MQEAFLEKIARLSHRYQPACKEKSAWEISNILPFYIHRFSLIWHEDGKKKSAEENARIAHIPSVSPASP